ncbi:DUF3179 domain-containing (seleno)protein [Flammeovirgaceae bacterium SG7u.111]|nr:DUF3179 domain-containing (seleno)protein [Flammeovirgaceae bacterium SG7u.132]WPO36106.1 DUF3179 domain-containing (seleno)protein [Flammeovirgaceae bacterium SG7u.111]
MKRLFIILCFIFLSWDSYAQFEIPGVYQTWETNFNKLTVPITDFKAYLPKNAISPIYNSDFWNQRQAEGVYSPDEPMLVVTEGHIEKAYPVSVLIYHNIINDGVGRKNVAVTFCPLSGSIAVYNRKVVHNDKTQVLSFGTTGVLRYANMVMYDHETETWWQQLDGDAVAGEFAGAKMEIVPFKILSYKRYYELYPYGLVMANNIDETVRYGTNPYYRYDDIKKPKPFLYSGLVNDRLPAMQRVLSIQSMGEYFIYPLSYVSVAGVLNDTPNDNFVVIFYEDNVLSPLDEEYIKDSKDIGTAVVFSSMVEGKRLTFKKENGKFIDDQTGSVWDITGKCDKGEYKGKQLKLMPYGLHFSFSPLLIRPQSRIFEEN